MFFVSKILSQAKSDSEQKQLLIGLNNSYILLHEFIINQCQIGYKGFLCSTCDRSGSYYKVADAVCKKCSDNFILTYIFRAFLNIFWFMIFRMYYINNLIYVIYYYTLGLLMNIKLKKANISFILSKIQLIFFRLIPTYIWFLCQIGQIILIIYSF